LLGGVAGLDEGLVPLLVLAVVGHVYTATLLIVCAARKSRVLFGAAFSEPRYYLIMGWAPLTFVVLSALVDLRFAPFAVVAAVGGMVGETLLGYAWSRFFEPPIWTYSYRSLLRGRTATINVLPWMIGALLFVSTGRLLGVRPDGALWSPSSPLAVSAAALLLTTPAAWLLLDLGWKAERRARRFTKARFALFCLPIVATAMALSVLCDPRYAVLMAAFAVVGTVTEYAYGRSMSLFFERPLWTYHHLQWDQGHSSAVTPPLWALGGLYFYLLAAQVGLG
jgi:hypothetical protein